MSQRKVVSVLYCVRCGWETIVKLNYMAVIFVVLAAVTLTGCSSMKPYSESLQFNSADGAFQHPKGYRHEKSFLDLHGLARAFFTREDDPAETDGFPLLDPAALAPPTGDGPHVTWVGHSTLLFTYRVVSVLTDPVFSERASPFKAVTVRTGTR